MKNQKQQKSKIQMKDLKARKDVKGGGGGGGHQPSGGGAQPSGGGTQPSGGGTQPSTTVLFS